MASTDLENRMKIYEAVEGQRRLISLLPIMARMDGICFHSFTRDMERPYDEKLSRVMINTMMTLAKEFNANAAYTQSDEITLAWYLPYTYSEMYCGGRIQKMVSHLAARTTLFFNRSFQGPGCFDQIDAVSLRMRCPCFDARVWNVPSLTEAANCFLWREQDATKNSIAMAAQSVFSHRELQDKSGSDMQEMLFQKGINWNNYPNFFKRGTFITRRKVVRPFTADEIEKLPPKHEARSNPGLTVERTEYHTWTDLPKFSTIDNREQFLFHGETPINRSGLPAVNGVDLR